MRLQGLWPEAALVGVRDRIEELGERGARVVVCTCSTIGDVAERAATEVPTLRVDRPMARRAVALGARIGVVAALESTLVPTKALVEQEAAAAGEQPSIELVVVDGAWTDFEADDMVGYLHKITDSARALAESVDVIVLARRAWPQPWSTLETWPCRCCQAPGRQFVMPWTCFDPRGSRDFPAEH